MKWISYGPNAWLLRFAERVDGESFVRGQGILEEVRRRPPPGLQEIVPGLTTILFEFDAAPDAEVHGRLRELTERFRSLPVEPLPQVAPVEIPVVYDGPDLERVASHHGLSAEEVCRLHSARVYHVHLLGFSPGFPYLGELDSRLHTPRLASPRPRVVAGSVAIGGEHTGIYSVDSPGGWNIIGHTPLKLFDASRGDGEAMFLLKPGDRVKFVLPKKA